MKMKSIITALPTGNGTGWGNAGRRIVEEMKKVALVTDLNDTGAVKNDFPTHFMSPLAQAIRGVDLLPLYPHVASDRMVGYSFCEDDVLLRRYALNAERNWDVIAVGSSWAHATMLAAVDGLDIEPDVVTAIQGVDGDVFCPSEDVKADPDWFTIFSGGKWEFRKGQDVVIRAVAVMMEHHKDVRLVASWWNPWPQSADTMRASKLIDVGGVIGNVAEANGIPAERLQMIHAIPHEEVSAAINHCDVGLFPNRCEAGTNLVLMEAMSCGLPVIATAAHGHKDVLGSVATIFQLPAKEFPVYRSNGGDSMHVANWFEPDLDVTIQALEDAYAMRGDRLRAQGYLNREAMKTFTWAGCANTLVEACQE